MFDKLVKTFQKKKGGGLPETDDSAEKVENVEIDSTLGDIDAALAEADRLTKKQNDDARRERERQERLDRELSHSGSFCGCGGR